MDQFMVQPGPGVAISNADESHLPLYCFHLVFIVEPDPETYMPLPGDAKNLGLVLENLNAAIDQELDPDHEVEYAVSPPKDVDRNYFAWIHYDDIDLFDQIAETTLHHISFNLTDYKDLENLNFYLHGLKDLHPDWRIGVIGGMFEDDVITIANLVRGFGFDTTVIARYCISNSAFINLDNLWDHINWERKTVRELGGEPNFPLDDLDLDDLEDEEDGDNPPEANPSQE